MLGELGGTGGLAGTLEADEQHAQWAARVDWTFAFAEELRELVGHDLDGHLARIDGFDDGLAEAGDFDTFGEVLGDLEIDVGGHQRRAHLGQRRGDIFLGELGKPSEVAEGLGEFVGEVGEHGTGRKRKPGWKGKRDGAGSLGTRPGKGD